MTIFEMSTAFEPELKEARTEMEMQIVPIMLIGGFYQVQHFAVLLVAETLD